MTISVEKARALLALPPSADIAKALKEWRAKAGYSQAEAAIRLGVPVRTLQGWELGRPMPYPALLQRAVGIPTRPADRFSLIQSEFPREFAEFIDFVGAHALNKEIRKIEKRFNAVDPSTRALYGDRYFFQEQCIRFTFEIPAFGLNVSNPTAVRAASLIAGINRVKRALSATGVSRFRSMVIDNLKLDRDMRQIEHEIRCATHFALKGYKTTFADLENIGQFDLLLDTSTGPVEVECKTVTLDTGAQIKAELVASISESFQRIVKKAPPVSDSGLFTMRLKKPVANCIDLPRQLEMALKSGTPTLFEATDFSLTFSPRPLWQEMLNSERWPDLNHELKVDPEGGDNARSIMPIDGRILVLDMRPHAPPNLHRRLVEILKNAADQCSGDNPSAIWLHFAGFPEEDIRTLFEFSMNGIGAGLNVTVAEVLHPSLSSTDRSHVQRIRFSCSSRNLNDRLAPDSNLILGRAVSHDGICYDVTNKLSRFINMAEI